MLSPINQQIVSSKPAISKNCRNRQIQRSDQKFKSLSFSRRKTDRDGNPLINNSARGAIKQTEMLQRYLRGGKVVMDNDFWVNEAVSRPGVNESEKGIRIVKERNGKGII